MGIADAYQGAVKKSVEDRKAADVPQREEPGGIDVEATLDLHGRKMLICLYLARESYQRSRRNKMPWMLQYRAISRALNWNYNTVRDLFARAKSKGLLVTRKKWCPKGTGFFVVELTRGVSAFLDANRFLLPEDVERYPERVQMEEFWQGR